LGKKPVDSLRKKDLDIVTTLSSKVFDMDMDAYDKTFEQLKFSLIDQNLLNPEYQSGPIAPFEKFVYKLQGSEAVFGPFPSFAMKAWENQGFFGEDQQLFIKNLKSDSFIPYKSGMFARL
jgi:hypothetical protein